MNSKLNHTERRHLARVKSLPCSLCDAPPPSEAHHIEQGLHFAAVALCAECHRGPIMGLHGQRRAWAIRKMDELKALDVIDVLSDLFSLRGVPRRIRADNGPEFIAKAVQDWIAAVGSTTAYIEPGSPWENGYCESFNAKLRDELLNGEVFYTLKEASVVIEQWRKDYNTIRPHSSLGYQPPVP